jgi:CRISPR-associated endoribonuclease Cas6
MTLMTLINTDKNPKTSVKISPISVISVLLPSMPFSIILNGYPKDNVPVPHVQGPALQGMFLHLMEQVDSVVSKRLHDESGYHPYTLSPLGLGERGHRFRGFQLPQEQVLKTGTPCYVRITLLDDLLFPIFSRYFLARPEPTFHLGETEFTVTSVLATPESENQWSNYITYHDLIERAKMQARCPRSQDNPPPPLPGGERRITLRFVTPTSFSKGDVDLPLPLPRLVFQSYWKRFTEFHSFEFLPDFAELVDLHTGVSMMSQMRTDTIKTKKVTLIGFTGKVSFEISKKAPPELVIQMNLLADFAFFCGTGKKTTMGMGQTRRIEP